MLLTRKIFSIALTILILAYSGGISITKHLCEGKVIAKAVNAEVKKCKKSESLSLSTNSEERQFNERSCCDTESMFFQANAFEKNASDLNYSVATLTTPITFDLALVLDEPSFIIFGLSPPIVGPPIYLAYEQFLI